MCTQILRCIVLETVMMTPATQILLIRSKIILIKATFQAQIVGLVKAPQKE